MFLLFFFFFFFFFNVTSPGKLTHSQAKINKSRRNSHTKEEVNNLIIDIFIILNIYQKKVE